MTYNPDWRSDGAGTSFLNYSPLYLLDGPESKREFTKHNDALHSRVVKSKFEDDDTGFPSKHATRRGYEFSLFDTDDLTPLKGEFLYEDSPILMLFEGMCYFTASSGGHYNTLPYMVTTFKNRPGGKEDIVITTPAFPTKNIALSSFNTSFSLMDRDVQGGTGLNITFGVVMVAETTSADSVAQELIKGETVSQLDISAVTLDEIEFHSGGLSMIQLGLG